MSGQDLGVLPLKIGAAASDRSRFKQPDRREAWHTRYDGTEAQHWTPTGLRLVGRYREESRSPWLITPPSDSVDF